MRSTIRTHGGVKCCATASIPLRGHKSGGRAARTPKRCAPRRENYPSTARSMASISAIGSTGLVMKPLKPTERTRSRVAVSA
jgi:hypothetical protein